MTRRSLVFATAVAGLCGLVAVPVGALIGRLTSVPLGPGTATITWSGRSGITPTISSVQGVVHGYPVTGSGRVPRVPSVAGTSKTVPPSITLATVSGQLGGDPFSIAIHLNLTASAGASGSGLATITGTFGGESVSATVSPATARGQFLRFAGTVGTLRVTGTIGPPTPHGNRSTAHATFDVTKG